MPWHLVEAVVLAMPHQGERGAHNVLEIIVILAVVVLAMPHCHTQVLMVILKW